MAQIFLVRHGETDWNREHRLQGNLDVCLNEAGIAQASALARRLENLPIQAVLTSPLARARQTAAIVSSKRKWPVALIYDLREIDHGIWTGMRLKTIIQRHPSQFAVWRFDPDRSFLEGAEQLREAYRRAARFLSWILKRVPNGDVLVVGHGIINSLLLCAATGRGVGRIWEFPQPNASLAVLKTQRDTVVAIEAVTNGAIN